MSRRVTVVNRGEGSMPYAGFPPHPNNFSRSPMPSPPPRHYVYYRNPHPERLNAQPPTLRRLDLSQDRRKAHEGLPLELPIGYIQDLERETREQGQRNAQLQGTPHGAPDLGAPLGVPLGVGIPLEEEASDVTEPAAQHPEAGPDHEQLHTAQKGSSRREADSEPQIIRAAPLPDVPPISKPLPRPKKKKEAPLPSPSPVDGPTKRSLRRTAKGLASSKPSPRSRASDAARVQPQSPPAQKQDKERSPAVPPAPRHHKPLLKRPLKPQPSSRPVPKKPQAPRSKEEDELDLDAMIAKVMNGEDLDLDDDDDRGEEGQHQEEPLGSPHEDALPLPGNTHRRSDDEGEEDDHEEEEDQDKDEEEGEEEDQDEDQEHREGHCAQDPSHQEQVDREGHEGRDGEAEAPPVRDEDAPHRDPPTAKECREEGLPFPQERAADGAQLSSLPSQDENGSSLSHVSEETRCSPSPCAAPEAQPQGPCPADALPSPPPSQGPETSSEAKEPAPARQAVYQVSSAEANVHQEAQGYPPASARPECDAPPPASQCSDLVSLNMRSMVQFQESALKESSNAWRELHIVYKDSFFNLYEADLVGTRATNVRTPKEIENYVVAYLARVMPSSDVISLFQQGKLTFFSKEGTYQDLHILDRISPCQWVYVVRVSQ